MSTIAIVLASGRGERLGGPKALLAWPPGSGALPLAAAHVDARRDCSRVLVVVRASVAVALRKHAPQVFAGRGELVVSTASDSLGPAGSLAAAAERLRAGDSAVIVTPVDCPPASTRIVAALLEGFHAGANIVASRPQCGSRRGHPVAVSATLLERYYASQPPRPLREVLRAQGDGVVDVVVEDPTVLLDINTPQDLASWLKHHGQDTAGGRNDREITVPTFFE